MDACPLQEDLLEDIAAFIDGTLSPEERVRITEHLARCESCYEVFAGAVHFQNDTGGGGVIEPPLTEKTARAILDGTLSPEARARITEHLARCESCYEVFAGAVHFQNDTDGGGVLTFPLEGEHQDLGGSVPAIHDVGVLPGPRAWEKERDSRRSSRWLALAASVLFVAALAGFGWRYLFARPTMTAAALTDPLEGRSEVAALVYDGDTFRGPGDELSLFGGRSSFMAGVHLIDLRLSTHGGDWQRTQALLQDLSIELRDRPFSEEIVKGYQALYLEMTDAPALQRLAPEITRREKELQEWLSDDPFFSFGLWAEAGRLAAVTQTPEFFETRKNRRFLSHLLKALPDQITDKELREPILHDLQAIERLWDKGELSEGDYGELAKDFQNIIRRIDDYKEDLSGDV